LFFLFQDSLDQLLVLLAQLVHAVVVLALELVESGHAIAQLLNLLWLRSHLLGAALLLRSEAELLLLDLRRLAGRRTLEAGLA